MFLQVLAFTTRRQIHSTIRRTFSHKPPSSGDLQARYPLRDESLAPSVPLKAVKPRPLVEAGSVSSNVTLIDPPEVLSHNSTNLVRHAVQRAVRERMTSSSVVVPFPYDFTDYINQSIRYLMRKRSGSATESRMTTYSGTSVHRPTRHVPKQFRTVISYTPNVPEMYARSGTSTKDKAEIGLN